MGCLGIDKLVARWIDLLSKSGKNTKEQVKKEMEQYLEQQKKEKEIDFFVSVQEQEQEYQEVFVYEK